MAEAQGQGAVYRGRRPLLGLRVALGSLLLGSVVACEQMSAAPGAPVLFLIVVDTLRPDRLSCYGEASGQTPHIDGLAARGTLFARAHAAASWTAPSMGAMLTSLHPSQLGLIEAEPDPGQHFAWRDVRMQRATAPPQRVRTLAERLRDAGFRTAAFVNQPGLHASEGFGQGFDVWYYPDRSQQIVAHDTAQPIPPPKQLWRGATTHSQQIDRSLIEALDLWLEGGEGTETGGDTRVGRFVWLHLLTPHTPYNARPAGERRRRLRVDFELYDAEVRAVDELIGEALEVIERRVGLDRAHVVFTSDHGEAFGEHGMTMHGHSLHAEVLHVPLVVASPSFARGRQVDAHVSTLDIAPTLLELAGLEPGELDEIEGVSLSEAVSGDDASRAAYSEGMLYGGTERSLIADGHKLMYDEQESTWALYDLASDPAELTDLSADRPDRARAMRARLVALHDRLRSESEGLEAVAGPAPSSTTAAENQRAQRERAVEDALRALGYAQ